MTAPVTVDTEAALCQAFIAQVPAEWIVYPETCGWDMLLVHRVGGWQIGVEAKKTLNAKVIVQAMDQNHQQGPDFRALLVGRVIAENAVIARKLGLTVITPVSPKPEPDWGGWQFAPKPKQGPSFPKFSPELPTAERINQVGSFFKTWGREKWPDHFPAERHKLPDYIPEVAAGVPSPMVLSDWKINAMRICVWVERNKTITRHVFRKIGIDPGRWMNGHWLTAGQNRGDWVAGPHFPANQMRREHPNVFEMVEHDYPEWSKMVTS